MLNMRRNSKMSVIWLFLGTYLSVVFITLILMIPICKKTVNMASDMYTSEFAALLNRNADTLDETILRMSYFPEQIVQHNYYYDLKHLPRGNYPPSVYGQISSVKASLKSYSLTKPLISETILMFAQNGLTTTTTRSFTTLEECVSSYLRYDELAPDELQKAMNECSGIKLLGAKMLRMLPDTESKPYITAIANRPGNGIVMAALLNCNVLEKYFVPEYIENNYLFFIESSGELLYANNEKLYSAAGNDAETIQYGKEKYVVIRSSMSISGCKIGVGIPYSHYYERQSYVTTMLMTFILLALAIGMVVAISYALFITRSIRRLAGDVSRTTKISEFEQIRNIINGSYSESEFLRQRIGLMERKLASNLILRLFYGSYIDEAGISRLREVCPVIFNVYKIAVVYVDVESIDSAMESLNSVCAFVVRLENDKLGVVLDADATIPNHYRCGVSSETIGLSNISQAFWQAWYALHMDEATETILSWSVFQRLYELLIAHKRNEFLSLLKEQTEIMEAKQEYMKVLFCTLGVVISSAARDCGCTAILPSYVDGVPASTQIEEIVKLADAVFDAIERKPNNATDSRVEAIISYIDQHYQDYDLCAESIGTALGISTRTVYKITQDTLGSSLGEYIDICRIRHATMLLSNGSLSVAEIASKCGFVSLNTFYRVFKKHCSVTPSQYRKIMEDQR